MGIRVIKRGSSTIEVYDDETYIGGLAPSSLLGRSKNCPWAAYTAAGDFIGHSKTVESGVVLVTRRMKLKTQ